MAKKDGEFKPKKVRVFKCVLWLPLLPESTHLYSIWILFDAQASKKGGSGKKLTGFMLFR